jgi:SAM-dependent methyltransferase
MRRKEAAGALFCPVCQSAVSAFQPHGNPAQLNIRCPICQSKACHRLCWAYFENHPGLFQRGGAFLHIAPEAELGRWLIKRCKSAGMKYRFGDIRDRKHHIDIESTNLPDASVDVLFACHVLNMVRDDRRAICEIARILKPGGTAVIPVPVAMSAGPTKETGPNSDMSERQKMFIDPNMYRAYTAADFGHRVRAAGLSLQHFAQKDVQNSIAAAWTLPDEPIQIATRPGRVYDTA